MKKSKEAPKDVTPKGSAAGIPVWDSFDEIAKRDSLKAHPRNPNKHSPDQLRLYLKIIRGNGWRRSVVVSRRSGLVIKGHGAVLAAELGKLSEVPVRYQEYASEAEEIKDLLADNELARLAQTNESELNELLSELEASGVDRELAGILKAMESPAVLVDVNVLPPPKMAWVLIGIPLVKFSRINSLVEQIAKEPEAMVESTLNDSKVVPDGR